MRGADILLISYRLEFRVRHYQCTVQTFLYMAFVGLYVVNQVQRLKF